MWKVCDTGACLDLSVKRRARAREEELCKTVSGSISRVERSKILG